MDFIDFLELKLTWIHFYETLGRLIKVIIFCIFIKYIVSNVSLESKILFICSLLGGIYISYIKKGIIKRNIIPRLHQFLSTYFTELLALYVLVRKGIYPLYLFRNHFEANWHIFYRFFIILNVLYFFYEISLISKKIREIQDSISQK